MAGANSSKLPPPSTGKLLTVLSIDGGGIRGLIPAVVLQFLEDELKKLEGDDGVRIADYFDVIAGTSTGGLVTTMLATPNGDEINPRPKYTADNIRDFYIKDGPKIFPPGTPSPLPIQPGPKYDGVHLRTRLEEELASTRLDQTWTNVVIPTFDIKRISPTIFSSYKVQQAPYKYLNALLSDICIATSAAPTYLPANNFTVENDDNTVTEYHTIDGGVAAGNPTLVALSEIGQDREEHPELYPMMERPDDCSNVLLVSLGCGIQAPSTRPGFTANEANQWSVLDWVTYQSRTPLLEFASDGAMDTMDYYIFSLFKAYNAERNYIRVQTDQLTAEMATMDNAAEKNLENLVKCAEEMLKAEVKRVNPVTFELEPIGDGTTYAEALTSVAERLYKERKTRIGTLASKN